MMILDVLIESLPKKCLDFSDPDGGWLERFCSLKHAKPHEFARLTCCTLVDVEYKWNAGQTCIDIMVAAGYPMRQCGSDVRCF